MKQFQKLVWLGKIQTITMVPACQCLCCLNLWSRVVTESPHSLLQFQSFHLVCYGNRCRQWIPFPDVPVISKGTTLTTTVYREQTYTG
jgi:hypothetical protein